MAALDPLKYQRPAAAAAPSDEWLTVKLRYKVPEVEVSTPFDVAVEPRRTRAGDNLGFASAVAAFGMTLRGSEHRGSATFDLALNLARKHRGADPHGHRGEFIRLVELASTLSAATVQ